MLYKYSYQSDLGIITLLANDHGLLGTWFENQSKFGGQFDLDKIEPIAELHQSMIINETVKWLNAYFAKQPLETINFQLMPQGTAFQQDVWTELQKIAYGQVITLDQLTDRIAARQTKGRGSVNMLIAAINSNPIAIMIPIHRVLVSSNQQENQLVTNHLGQVLREFESS
ncbi:methylated-DNA--[protein]-cysteine S-methyltransferase [Aerococcus urinaeequi]|uniref:methylated-DNA--[protein]-cysteine S-methyltransferase n=1 Tax=Aerococcus urinaeequi TaxID=51665 RepID=UPI000845FE3A|nr:methylated-DNA--[protein]-cysteine S-methyltransferase [Aerococcus urinaeequi]